MTAIAAVVGVATIVGLVALWPRDDARFDRLNLASQFYEAEVRGQRTVPCRGTSVADGVPCDRVGFRLNGGPDEGAVRRLEFPTGETSTPTFDVGEKVILAYNPASDPDFRYSFSDRQRRPVLLALTVLFAAAVILLGRLRGLAALVGLGASLAVLVAFVLPALLGGESPVLVALVGTSAVAFLALYCAHGFRSMTTVALLGTLGALTITVGLAALFTDLANFSGLANEEALLIRVGDASIDLVGLVLAGMVIGALGALDDVTVTQASAVAELRASAPAASRRDLYRAGIRIGRDHIASTVNTLALAYAGAALPLLILLVVSNQSLGSVANSEVVAIEIVATLVGSIGLVAAVPITTGLAAIVATSRDHIDASPVTSEPAREEPAEPDTAKVRDAADIDGDEFWERR